MLAAHSSNGFTATPQYNETLVLNELERRFYLYLIGGDYEKLFYTFEEQPEDSVTAINSSTMVGVTRIKLDVEVSETDRRRQASGQCADPEYKRMLDYMLSHRINSKIEKQDNLLATCSIIEDILPTLQEFSNCDTMPESVMQNVTSTEWLSKALTRFFSDQSNQKALGLHGVNGLERQIKSLGYPMLMWLMPRLLGEELQRNMHASLRGPLKRVRQYCRFISGAIATLTLQNGLPDSNRWILYSLAIINALPMFVLLNLINDELHNLIEQQRQSAEEGYLDEDKQKVLVDYAFAGDELRDIMITDELLKPHILETIGFKHFDPQPYILGYANNEALANVFFQSRAYALYRQLFKTGRIHPHETAIFLKKYKINKATLHQLNEADFSCLPTQINLHEAIQSH